ncbi:MAG: UvrD-helicase domain-containing protein, partial [Candidatus Adiutrix sp.]
GFLFSYDKLFGTKQWSKTDTENKASGKDNTPERTMRLFYVTCTRAKESLALIMYTSNCEAVKQKVISLEWFAENEICVIDNTN